VGVSDIGWQSEFSENVRRLRIIHSYFEENIVKARIIQKNILKYPQLCGKIVVE